MVQGALKDNALKGKTIVVTGGGTGLGKAMATYFSELGANIVITSRKLDVLSVTANEIESKTNNRVLAVACDVRNIEDVEKMYKEAEDNFGSVDVLVNNAAGNFISPTERLSANAFSTIIDIVLKGTANCTLTFGKKWIERKQHANILNIITTYAFTGSGYVVPSAVAKGGVLTMTRSLAAEWGKYGIRSNAIAPGPFPTKGAWDRLLPGELAEKFNFKNRVPLKRVGEHQELANLAAFLVSDFAAYINGEIITIDGGEWLQGAGQMNGMEAISPEMWDAIEKTIRDNNK
ncbi:NAD(P)-dependent dehydrogenase (short-subunit alcohol dehydrogenase family) [Sphingobacterium alimentarium]|uniref:NAD(P)-dependent dehydrogenase (Short-subunit alcohol dehydrogenase family) n=1 Tax=Sphingobacterium alimentarium TaxID=797292 RepID=A0A4R3VST4_9SPHI|nr:SDR family oxidoreductase [Sphingobacterium alimentarium]TCV12887.1 NAD(P)-dependent dehydrogenase (short-subunit alcohol dehydrogenase family) [Sphingobacterium alimentarium]